MTGGKDTENDCSLMFCVFVFRTRALFVEFPLYNINTDLLAVFTFLLEFPVSERAQLSLDLKTCSLHTLSHGMDLPLFLTVTSANHKTLLKADPIISVNFCCLKKGRGSLSSFFLSLTAPPAGLRDLFLCTWGRGCLETRAWLFPAFVERSKCLQSAVGHFRRLATPEPLCAFRPPMGVISTTTGHFYGLLSSSSAEPGSDPAQCDSAVPTGSQGEQMWIKPITSARLETCSTVEAVEYHA